MEKEDLLIYFISCAWASCFAYALSSNHFLSLIRQSHHYVLIQLSLGLVLVGIVVRIWWQIYTHLKRKYFTNWWDPDPTTNFDDPLEWDSVRRLTLGNIEPLSFVPGKKSGLIFGLVGIAFIAINILLFCVLILGLLFIVNPHVPAFMIYTKDGRTVTDAALDLSGNLTALLALIAALISIYFAYRQFQAKVIADNRQIWIAQLRKLLADTTALAVKSSSTTPLKRRQLRRKLDRSRLNLELLLNPSERDHRLLMYLIQRLSLLRLPDIHFIEDAHFLIEDIRRDEKQLEFDADWKEILNSTTEARIVGFIMRLSHVVLKREWERVKGTR